MPSTELLNLLPGWILVVVTVAALLFYLLNNTIGIGKGFSDWRGDRVNLERLRLTNEIISQTSEEPSTQATLIEFRDKVVMVYFERELAKAQWKMRSRKFRFLIRAIQFFKFLIFFGMVLLCIWAAVRAEEPFWIVLPISLLIGTLAAILAINLLDRAVSALVLRVWREEREIEEMRRNPPTGAVNNGRLG